MLKQMATGIAHAAAVTKKKNTENKEQQLQQQAPSHSQVSLDCKRLTQQHSAQNATHSTAPTSGQWSVATL